MSFVLRKNMVLTSKDGNEIRIRAQSGGRPLWFFFVLKTSQQMQGRRQDLRSENKEERIR